MRTILDAPHGSVMGCHDILLSEGSLFLWSCSEQFRSCWSTEPHVLNNTVSNGSHVGCHKAHLWDLHCFYSVTVTSSKAFSPGLLMNVYFLSPKDGHELPSELKRSESLHLFYTLFYYSLITNYMDIFFSICLKDPGGLSDHYQERSLLWWEPTLLVQPVVLTPCVCFVLWFVGLSLYSLPCNIIVRFLTFDLCVFS